MNKKPNIYNAIECSECNIPKGRGHEIIFENNELYCGKLLVFKQGCKFSMHYHMIKDETWYVDDGDFIYRWIDTETAEVHENILKKGSVSTEARNNIQELHKTILGRHNKRTLNL